MAKKKTPKRKDKGTRVAQGVYKLEDGRWRVTATARRPGGARLYREQVLEADEAPTEQDAIIARAQLVKQLQVEDEPQAIPARGRTTVNGYAESWLSRLTGHKFSTQERYIEALGLWILPFLGHLYCDAVTRGDVQDWVRWAESKRKKSGREYAQSSLDSWWRVLKTFLGDMAAEFERPNPTERLKGPRSSIRGIRESRTLSTADLGQLLTVIEAEHSAWLTEVTVMAYSGMRAGELYALRWDDVDEALGLIHVCRSVYRGREGTTKTDDPRDVALTQRLRDLLSTHRAQMLREQHPGLSTGLVFPSSQGGFRGSQALLNLLKLAGRKAGLPIRVGPQVLRRTFNTLMLEQGVDRTVLRAQMGHCSEAMTQRYAGIRPDQKQSAVAGLIDRVEGGT